MSRLFDDAASMYLEHGAAVVTSPPFTFACWFTSDEDPPDASQVLLSIGETTSANRYYLGWSAVLGRIYAGARDTADSYAQTSTSPSANVWQHACYVEAATNSRAVYLNGGGKGVETTNRIPSGLTATAVGATHTIGGRGAYWSGRIAWPCIWNVALSDSEVAQLASGLPPWCIRPSNIVALWDLTRNVSPETCYPGYGSYDMTLYNSPTYSTDDPPVGATPWARRASGIWTPGRR